MVHNISIQHDTCQNLLSIVAAQNQVQPSSVNVILQCGLSTLDTLGPRKLVLIIQVSLIQSAFSTHGIILVPDNQIRFGEFVKRGSAVMSNSIK